MPLLSTATGSFFAGRRANAFGRLWDPSLDLTPAFWIDASDTSSYTVSGTDMIPLMPRQGRQRLINKLVATGHRRQTKKLLYIPTK